MTLLSRTAENLYWLSRYMERADSLARTLEAAFRLSSLPATYGGRATEWESAVVSCGCADAFRATFAEATPQNVVDFVAFSPANPSSIRRCFEIARSNARAERTALTSEMWDTINSTYHELQGWGSRPLSLSDLPRFVAFVKEVSLRFDGSADRTMLRNDAFWFTRLGLYLERADNTARILDVKYHVLLPANAQVGGSLDYYQWASILRSVSALTSYRWVYRDSIKPWLVSDLLILRDEMPRSLASCYANITNYLDEIADAYGRQGVSQRSARAMRARLRNATIDGIFQSGLHEFVGSFIAANNQVGMAIAEQYLQ